MAKKTTKKKAVKKKTADAKPATKADPNVRGRARVEEDRPTAVGAPGTVVDFELPSEESDGFLEALIADARRNNCNFVIVVNNESDANRAQTLVHGGPKEGSVKLVPTMEKRGTWRRVK